MKFLPLILVLTLLPTPSLAQITPTVQTGLVPTVQTGLVPSQYEKTPAGQYLKGSVGQSKARIAFKAPRKPVQGSVGGGSTYPSGVAKRQPAVNLRALNAYPQATSGLASYYWQGQRVASGGWFNPQAMTAAHKTLPFGTKVVVTNLKNGQSTVVTINDRGPYVAGRVIDLSLAAARAVGMTAAGVVPIHLVVLGK
jgi:rare lipoprotein A